MEYGTVKWFDSREEKRYGFIVRDTGGEIFFHLNDGRGFGMGEERPVFSEGVRLSHIPLPGDRVAFAIGHGTKGEKASPWGFEAQYNEAKELIERRPKPLRYRVVVVYDQEHLIGGKTGEPDIEWGGEDGGTLEQLSGRYPRNKYDPLRYFGHDDFNRTSTIQVLKDGNWVNVEEDPRPIVSDNTRVQRW